MMLADRRGAPSPRPTRRPLSPSERVVTIRPGPERGPGKRVMDIEDVLRWAYRDELPKDQGFGGGETSPIARFAELGTMVDSSGYDSEPGFPAALGAPHPDALLVQGAVHRLRRFAGYTFDAPRLAPDDWFELDQHAASRIATRDMANLVVVHAKLGGRPAWWQGPPVLSPVIGANGKPRVLQAVSDGYIVQDRRPVAVPDPHNAPCQATRAGNYPEGAFCPLAWEPAPAAIVAERAQYLAWWAGLDVLAGELALASITVLPPSAPPRPWLGDRELGKPPALFAPTRAAGAAAGKPQSREAAAAARALGRRRPLPKTGSAPAQTGVNPKIIRETGTKD